MHVTDRHPVCRVSVMGNKNRVSEWGETLKKLQNSLHPFFSLHACTKFIACIIEIAGLDERSSTKAFQKMQA